LKEGEGETNRADPRSLGSGSPVISIEEKSPEIPDLGNIVKPPREPINIYKLRAQITPLDQEIPENYWKIFDYMEAQGKQNQTSTLEYPIVDPVANAPMKAIPLQNIPSFHGMTLEDPNAFLFEFVVLCKGYDYTTNLQKLKLFPSTLKGAVLWWFMG